MRLVSPRRKSHEDKSHTLGDERLLEHEDEHVHNCSLRLLLRLESHHTLVELDLTESIERFSLDPKPVPEFPEKWILNDPHEHRRDW